MKSILFLFLAIFLNTSCEKDFSEHFPYRPPEKLEDDLNVGTLKEAQMDTQMILKASVRIHHGKYGEVHSMLIYKGGQLVFEEYFDGHEYQWDRPSHYGDWKKWDYNMIHYAHSVSKSITSICVGIAIDKGYISNVNQSIFDYLPAYRYLETPENQHITIEHLLTGTSGLQWAEWNAPLSSLKNDQIAIWFHEKGPADFVLSRPMIALPGTHFIYSGGNIELLGLIIENASKMSFENFSKKHLFEPLGIDSAYWHIIYPTGEVHAAAGLRITPREMIKIGALMLNNGIWNGEQIVSEDWIEKSRYPYLGFNQIKIPNEGMGKVGYSYTWWTKQTKYKGKEIEWYFANGWGGQKIMVLPKLNYVIVFTGAEYTGKVHQYEIFERFILPAMVN